MPGGEERWWEGEAEELLPGGGALPAEQLQGSGGQVGQISNINENNFYVSFASNSRPSASGVYRFGDQYFEVQEELEAEAAAANGCNRGGGEYYDSDGVCCYGEEEGLFGDEEDFEEEEDVDVGAFVAGEEDEELLAAEARSHRGGGICLEGDDVEEEALLVMQVKHMKACMMQKK